MKHKYGIGFIVLSMLFVYLLSFRIYGSYKEKEISTEIEESVSTDGQALNEECFYLYEINGYVVVFLSDQKTPYEYTNILYEELPQLLQNEIQNGKYMKDLDELYGFLENYSS